MVFQLRNVWKFYGHLAALRQVDFLFAPGEGIVLSGPNGAGKTTLLRIMALIAAPSKGGISYFGEDVRAHGIRLKAQIGFAGHIPYLYQDLTVRENLDFFSRIHRRSRHDVDQALDEFQLAQQEKRLVRTLSRGLQHRVNLARAFLHDPVLVLLDEPYAHLDSDSARRLNDRILRRRGRGGTAVLATHQSAPAQAVATRWISLDKGRISSDTASGINNLE